MNILSFEELKKIFRGGYSYGVTPDGYLQAFQYTDAQMAYLEKTSEAWLLRSRAGNAKTLEFVTDATEFSFAYKLLWKAEVDAIEIMRDGVIERIVRGDELPDSGVITHRLPEGRKAVTVYLVARAEIVLRDFVINGNLEPVQKGEKVLWLGDSITQGLGPYRPAHTYVSVANRVLGYDIINQGIGGLIYDAGLLAEMPGYTPDKIIVALGTNQYREENAVQAAEEYHARLHELYPDTPVLCITPLWRPDAGEDAALLKKLRAYGEAIRGICSQYSNITVADGFSMVHHAQDYFLDHVHPNALGSEVFGRNLVEFIRKTGF